jgi:hypothetical protein
MLTVYYYTDQTISLIYSIYLNMYPPDVLYLPLRTWRHPGKSFLHLVTVSYILIKLPSKSYCPTFLASLFILTESILSNFSNFH